MLNVVPRTQLLHNQLNSVLIAFAYGQVYVQILHQTSLPG